MESNGTKDCIHVSQSTADELIALGKGQWVHAREDKITAKGMYLDDYCIPHPCMHLKKGGSRRFLDFKYIRERRNANLLGSTHRVSNVDLKQ